MSGRQNASLGLWLENIRLIDVRKKSYLFSISKFKMQTIILLENLISMNILNFELKIKKKDKISQNWNTLNLIDGLIYYEDTDW